MGRGGSRGRSSSPPSRSSSSATKPMPAKQAPQTPISQPQTGGGMLGGIGSTIVQGMAFGAGSAVAHQAVNSLMGGSSKSHDNQKEEQAPQQQYQQQQQSPCQVEMSNFSSCLSTNENINFCQNFSDMLKLCKQNNNLA